MRKKSDYCAIVAHHLNVPYGDILTSTDISDLFIAGTYKNIEIDSLKGALLHSIFECSPDTLGWACIQAGSDLVRANNLYVELLEKNFPENRNWERIMRDAGVAA